MTGGAINEGVINGEGADHWLLSSSGRAYRDRPRPSVKPRPLSIRPRPLNEATPGSRGPRPLLPRPRPLPHRYSPKVSSFMGRASESTCVSSLSFTGGAPPGSGGARHPRDPPPAAGTPPDSLRPWGPPPSFPESPPRAPLKIRSFPSSRVPVPTSSLPHPLPSLGDPPAPSPN